MKQIMEDILVTKSFLPPIAEYQEYLQKVWDSSWLTNSGPLVLELEKKMAELLGVKHFLYTSNGTIAIQMVIKALELDGEIITTPYSYVATTSSVIWENCKPVFADIDSETLCLDPKEVEKKITDKTVAILPVHVYGVPCDVEAFEALSKKFNIPVIYDAAHAFMTQYKESSVLNFGTASTLSFHATKLFHTVEGGAIVTNDDELAKKLALVRSFGHVGDEHFRLGVNGKNSEIHAAMGLTNLKYVNDILIKRKELSTLYDQQLEKLLASGKLKRPVVREAVHYNHAYYPVLFESHEKMMAVNDLLRTERIFARRYFFPSLNTISYIQGESCPISESVAERVLCLPLYHDLRSDQVIRITQLITERIELL